MKRAALYARVSSERQKQEQTIESQVAELERQIRATDHVLVKEYIDDGYSGKYLDRPALDALRGDLKADLFDAVYFLDADRIARTQVLQTIVIDEILKAGKRVIIKGKDYEQNPENTFTLQVLGAVAEFEHAKITERMARGRLHRLRMGQLSSQGHIIYGYTYARKTATSAPALVINENEAAIVRWIFETYATGSLGLCAISRSLEERCIPACRGGMRWNANHLRCMLTNVTYTGTRYFNRTTAVRDASGKRALRVPRDRKEWIAVPVPTIVSQELFDRAQERLRRRAARYRRPPVRYLLSGLIRCGECGRGYSSSRWYEREKRRNGEARVTHCAAYRCNTAFTIAQHDRARQHCHNSRIYTHLLESKVLEMIEAAMLDPGELGRSIAVEGGVDNRKVGRALERIAKKVVGLEGKRRQLIERYATEQLTSEAYVKANRELDAVLDRLGQKRTELADVARWGQFGERVRQFCASARAEFEACHDLGSTRKFLLDHIDRIVFNRHRVTIFGAIAQNDPRDAALPFRIEGAIDRAAVRRDAGKRGYAGMLPAMRHEQRTALVTC